jgi:cation/acetate symporter
MRGVGVVFSRFLEVNINTGVIIGMGIVFFYAVIGGMKGITYTQVAQYCILIFAFLVPAIFISIMMTNNPLPQLGFGSKLVGSEGVYLLDKLDGLNQELGFAAYTSGVKSKLDIFCITAALMVGTAGLPHVIVRFFTVRKVRDARYSAGWALVFIAILYTTAPAIAAFARTNLINTVNDKEYVNIPSWFKNWEKTGLIAWVDKNNDGIVQYRCDAPFEGKPRFHEGQGAHGQRLLSNNLTDCTNELFVDRDIIVLANPEIAKLPNWVVGLVAAGGLAAALSTAA